jgi:predicted dinucleotide-binding enzyme
VGHQVLFGSRDLDKAESVAASARGSARAGDFDAAAAFGEVILDTVRGVLPSSLLREPRVLDGKIVIDCNNSAILGLDLPDPEGRPGLHFASPVPSLAERLAADIPQSRVVKAFNTVSGSVVALDRETLHPHHVSIFLCGDDAPAKAVVRSLAEELGFVGVESGALEYARLVEALADLLRLQILELGSGPGATLSMNALPEI